MVLKFCVTAGEERMRCGHKNAQSYALAFCLDPEITIKLHRRFKITIGTLQNHWRFVKALQNVHEDSSFFFSVKGCPRKHCCRNVISPELMLLRAHDETFVAEVKFASETKMCMSFSPGLLLLPTENIASARKRENILE